MKAKKMLINTRQDDEVRVALMEGKRLLDLDIELSHRKQKKANIYKAKISRIEPSLNAIFVDYGMSKHGFLPVKEIAPHYLPKHVRNLSDIDLKSIFKEGQDILIQVEKEERGNKGAAISTYISLAGCYLVIMPNNPKAGGISRKIEGDARQDLKNMMKHLNIPENMGAILRTACIDRAQEELQWDIDSLCKTWQAIDEAYQSAKSPCLIYQESDVVLRSIRDYLRQEITEIVVDTEHAYNRIIEHIKRLRPNFVDRIKLHESETPLFSHYNIETQIETAHVREITLPSGASIVIDPAEALTAIDINSAKATKGGNIDETALNINLEAADEIARQLRLRDLGGLIVIDFIDMNTHQDQQKVEQRLSAALRSDRARTQINHISRFGLLEMSRQRLRSSLDESTRVPCPRCHGQGTIRGVESLALSMMRNIKQALVEKAIVEIQVQLPISVSTFLLNEKRQLIDQMEKTHHVKIIIIPNPHLETPNSDIKLIKAKRKGDKSSHQLLQAPAPEKHQHHTNVNTVETPVVSQTTPSNTPHSKPSKPGFFNRVYQGLFGSENSDHPKENTAPQTHDRTKTQHNATRKPQASPQQNQRNRNRTNKHSETKNTQNTSQRSQNSTKSQQKPAQQNRRNTTPNQQAKPDSQKRMERPTSTQTKKPPIKSNTPPNIETQKETKATPPKPKSTLPKKPSKMVKDILAKDSVLSNSNSQKVETTAKSGTMNSRIKLHSETEATNFSLQKAQTRLADLSKHPMEIIHTSSEKMTSKLPEKMTIEDQQV